MSESEFREMAISDSQINPARIKAFEELPGPSKYAGGLWTAEMDSLLLKYWPIKDKAAVAKALGVAHRTAYARYRRLMKNKAS